MDPDYLCEDINRIRSRYVQYLALSDEKRLSEPNKVNNIDRLRDGVRGHIHRSSVYCALYSSKGWH